jgi:hypothetical protein
MGHTTHDDDAAVRDYLRSSRDCLLDLKRLARFATTDADARAEFGGCLLLATDYLRLALDHIRSGLGRHPQLVKSTSAAALDRLRDGGHTPPTDAYGEVPRGQGVCSGSGGRVTAVPILSRRVDAVSGIRIERCGTELVLRQPDLRLPPATAPRREDRTPSSMGRAHRQGASQFDDRAGALRTIEARERTDHRGGATTQEEVTPKILLEARRVRAQRQTSQRSRPGLHVGP